MIGDSYISYERLELMEKPLPDKLSEGDDLEELDEEPEELGEEFDKIYAYVDSKTGSVIDPVSIRAGKKTPRNTNPNNECHIAEVIPFWSDIVKTVDDLCRFVPQLEFFGMEIAICEEGFKLSLIHI